MRNKKSEICGADHALGATDNAEIGSVRTSVPVFFTTMEGMGHIDAYMEGGFSIIAWLLWPLSGETERGDDFLDSDGYFQTGVFDLQVKNW